MRVAASELLPASFEAVFLLFLGLLQQIQEGNNEG